MSLATVVGLIAFSAVSFVFSLIFLLGIATAFGGSEPKIASEGILKVDMSTFILTEQSTESNPMEIISGGETMVGNVGIWDAVRSINTAANDPAVKFIYLLPDNVMGGTAQIEEFRAALQNFKNSGKAVISFIENPTNAGYYLASVSDKIYMTPYEGFMNNLTGVSSQMIFLKDILDRMGINVQLIRHGKYKSAGEMFVRNSSSKENLEQNEAMVSSLWKSWASQISESRGITIESLNGMLNGLELNFPEDFLAKGLVDELVTLEELNAKLSTLYIISAHAKPQSVSIQDYAKVSNTINLKAKTKVAVIYVDGDIVDGKVKQQVAGDRFAKIISDVRKDSTVRAAVLRVNSPGGSVLASEKIKTEIELLQKRMPVVASFGNYAASGGYWISAGCDKIFTNATTLTGSIGVFSMIPDFSGTLDKKLHVNIAHVKSNKHADMYGLMRPLTPAETAYMQASVEKIYEKFTSLVAEGREMSVTRVDEIAQGRVWTGSEALGINLADQIGTLEDAILWATLSIDGISDINEVNIVGYPKPLTSLELLLESLGGSDTNILAGTPFQSVGEVFSNWNTSESGKAYARMSEEFIIR